MIFNRQMFVFVCVV